MYNRGPVIVMELPEKLTSAEANQLCAELQPLLEGDRPRIVLDCSQLEQMDWAGIETLLHCMEEAMKRDGDLKLAALTPTAAAMLELMRVDRLFEIFETANQAVHSFQTVAPVEAAQELPWYSPSYGLGGLKAAS
jgi:anti-sigma B factor antagonist